VVIICRGTQKETARMKTRSLVIKDSVATMFAIETPRVDWFFYFGRHWVEKIMAWWNNHFIVMPLVTVVVDSHVWRITELSSSFSNKSCGLRIWNVSFFRRRVVLHGHSHHHHSRLVRLHHVRHHLLLRHTHHVWLHHLLLLRSCLVLLL
jgi:hypothetical protein